MKSFIYKLFGYKLIPTEPCVYRLSPENKDFVECTYCNGGTNITLGEYGLNLKKAFEKSDLVEDSIKFTPKKYYDPSYNYNCPQRNKIWVKGRG